MTEQYERWADSCKVCLLLAECDIHWLKYWPGHHAFVPREVQ